ncbi:protein yellow-like [Cloeon dipterum]|uniref:protein yellow-like n=1 Tax=Cloeon dipterum TaxID=197152 RepID=UPI0032203C53
MTPFFVAIFLLGLSSLATAANFNKVFEWNELDFEWPSEAKRTQALRDGTYKPENFDPLHMAVYGSRIFFTISERDGISVTLVSVPKSSASSAPPKLTPFPSWDMHAKEDCNKIENARTLDVDSVGRLWVLDQSSRECKPKLWTIDLINNDQIKLTHQFSSRSIMHDLVLDETPDGTFAYISRGGIFGEQYIVVFSLERNESWIVDTPGIDVYSIVLSPRKDQEQRQLYFGKSYSDELYSISAAALRNGTGTSNPKPVGIWTKPSSYRMLMDNHGTLYAAFEGRYYISSWNTSQPFEEQRFHEVAELYTFWPFTFALDSSGTFWMTEFDKSAPKTRFRLLKATAPELYAASASGEAQNRKLINLSVFFAFLVTMAFS